MRNPPLAGTKLVARVTRVLQPGVHALAEIRDGQVREVANLPRPDRVEIECEGGPGDPCMMFRYTATDQFCGDTWHLNLGDAVSQATFEYGLTLADFREVTR